MDIVIDANKVIPLGADGVPVETFIEICEKLAIDWDVAELEYRENVEGLDGITAVIWYRDSDNYKYPFALNLRGDGHVLIQEPEWEMDESEDMELFWSELREAFNVPTPFY